MIKYNVLKKSIILIIKKLRKSSCIIFLIFALSIQIVRSQDSVAALKMNKITETIKIVVANFDELREYYYTPGMSSTVLSRTCSRQTYPSWRSPLYKVLTLLQIKENTRMKCAQELNDNILGGATLSEFSPDSFYVFMGFNRPDRMPPAFINKIKIYKTDSKIILQNMSFENDNYASDLVWSRDQKFVIILLEQSKIKHSLYGIFRLLAGHPISLHTYFLKVINLATNDVKDVPLCEDIEDGLAIFDYREIYYFLKNE
jgi:hypothetical protein